MTTEKLVSAQPEFGPFCQSCAMPLRSPEDFGTNLDGSRQKDYCHYCYSAGALTQPDITLREMIDFVIVPWARATSRPEAEVRSDAEHVLPDLKRWRA